MNLEVIRFLLEHGADRSLKAKTNGLTSQELAKNHCASEQVLDLLQSVNQVKFYQD